MSTEGAPQPRPPASTKDPGPPSSPEAPGPYMAPVPAKVVFVAHAPGACHTTETSPVHRVGCRSRRAHRLLALGSAKTLVFLSNVRADRADMLDLSPSWPRQYSGRRRPRGKAVSHCGKFLIVQNCWTYLSSHVFLRSFLSKYTTRERLALRLTSLTNHIFDDNDT